MTPEERDFLDCRRGMIRSKLRRICWAALDDNHDEDTYQALLVAFFDRRLFKIDYSRPEYPAGYLVFAADKVLEQELWRIVYPEKERNLPPGHTNSVTLVDPLDTYSLTWAEGNQLYRRQPGKAGGAQQQKTPYLGITRAVEERVRYGSEFVYGNTVGHCDHCQTPISSTAPLAALSRKNGTVPLPRSCFSGLTAPLLDVTATNSEGDEANHPYDPGPVPAIGCGGPLKPAINPHRVTSVTNDGDPVSDRWVQLDHRRRSSLRAAAVGRETAGFEYLMKLRPPGCHCPQADGHKGVGHQFSTSSTGRKRSNAGTIDQQYDPDSGNAPDYYEFQNRYSHPRQRSRT